MRRRHEEVMPTLSEAGVGQLGAEGAPTDGTDRGEESMYIRRLMIVFAASALVLALTATASLAQSGHFIDRQSRCTDIGTQVQCTGKVAGLGGTTFEIRLSASGVATVECENPGGNVAPGQSFSFTAAGTSGPLPTPQNGQFVFSIMTDHPSAPAGSCPNPGWTATVVDVAFTTATLTLFEDGVQVDSQTVPVS